jgi:hypothetical protein
MRPSLILSHGIPFSFVLLNGLYMSLLSCSSHCTFKRLHLRAFLFLSYRRHMARPSWPGAMHLLPFLLHLVTTDTPAAHCFITLHFSFAAPAGWLLGEERFILLF